MKLNPVYTYILVIFSMIFWGMSFVWSKIVLQYYDPITTVLLRLLISSAILFTGLRIFNRIQKLNRQDYKLFFLSALLNPFLYFLGENYGLQLTSPTISSIIIAINSNIQIAIAGKVIHHHSIHGRKLCFAR